MIKRLLTYLGIIYRKILTDRKYNQIYGTHTIKVMDSSKTIKWIIEKNCSVSRFGDGEFILMQGRNIFFQKHDQLLVQKLNNVRNSDNLLVCVPDVFTKLGLNSLSKESKHFWKNTLIKNYSLLSRHFIEDNYGDSLISRFYIIRKKYSFSFPKFYLLPSTLVFPYPNKRVMTLTNSDSLRV